jgi:hypothetical protein
MIEGGRLMVCADAAVDAGAVVLPHQEFVAENGRRLVIPLGLDRHSPPTAFVE